MTAKKTSSAKSSSSKKSGAKGATTKTPAERARATQGSDFGDEPETLQGDPVQRHDARQVARERELSDQVVGGLPAQPRGPGHPPEPQPAASSVRPLVDESAADTPAGRRAARANQIAGVDSSPAPRVKVMATQHGYYDHARRRPGDVFTIDGTKLTEDVTTTDERTGRVKVLRKAGEIEAFSSRWMKLVPKDTPEGVTSSQEDLTRTTEDIKANRRKAGQAATTADARADRAADNDPLSAD